MLAVSGSFVCFVTLVALVFFFILSHFAFDVKQAVSGLHSFTLGIRGSHVPRGRCIFPGSRLKSVSGGVIKLCRHRRGTGSRLSVRHRGLVGRFRCTGRNFTVFAPRNERVLSGVLFMRFTGLVSSVRVQRSRSTISVPRLRPVRLFLSGGVPGAGHGQGILHRSIAISGGKGVFLVRYVLFLSGDCRVSVGSVSHRRRRDQVGQRLARGITRRLGAPIDDVRNCLRAVVDGPRLPSSGHRFFLRHYCSRDAELAKLLHSVSMLGQLSRTSRVFRLSRIGVRGLINRVRGRYSGRVRRGGVAARITLPNGPAVCNGCSLLCSVFHGLCSGTVTCTNRNVRVAIDYCGRSPGFCCFDFSSGNINISRRRIGHVFRHFCHISGNHDHGINKANLKLSVIGGNMGFRGKRVSTGDKLNGKVAFFFALGGGV